MRRTRKRISFRAAVLAGGLAAPAAFAASTPAALHYTARLHGIPLLDITYCLRLGQTDYDSSLEAHTVGLADFIVHGSVTGYATGSLTPAGLKPFRYVEHGRISGESFNLVIDYPAGSPAVRVISPAAEKYRLPVPASTLGGAIDGLAAIALEVLVTSRTGACQGSALVFDGRQLRRLTTHTAGSERLEPNARSAFAGEALRCDTVSIMQSGFLKGQDEARQARLHFSKAWLAPLSPGEDKVPVRFAFHADALGDIFVDLDRSAGVSCPGE